MRRWRCRAYRILLVDSAEGSLSGARQRRLERHLHACSICREELTALREVPTLLRAAALPQPGEEFWRQQRQALGEAIRQAPAPGRPRAWRWPPIEWRPQMWRYPIAVAAGLLLALGLYRLAADHQPQGPDLVERQLAGLDTDSLALVRDIMQALEPADEPASATEPDDSVLRAAAPLNDFAAVTDLPPVLQTSDLSDTELEGLDTLVGDEFG